MATSPPILHRRAEVLDVREELARVGSNTAEQHRLTFFFLLPDHAHAAEAATLIRQHGVTVEVEPMAMPWWTRIVRGRMYWCKVEVEIIPDAPELDALIDDLLIAAGKTGAQYDGWTGLHLHETPPPIARAGA